LQELIQGKFMDREKKKINQRYGGKPKEKRRIGRPRHRWETI
jgi:hypothetical protein